MNKHYFIADTHFGHSNIHLKFRKEFSSQEEHNETIHQNIMNIGNKQDCLWLLGDIFFKESEFWRLSAYAKKFQHVYYILGNHDKPSVVRYAMQHKNINIMGVEQRWGLWLAHVPVPDYELYRGNCVHGHLHSKVVQDLSLLDHESDYSDQDITDRRYFCVSCEQVDYKPISLEQIKEIRGWK
jgi:calcineurin-like phosphoesterase family protein